MRTLACLTAAVLVLGIAGCTGGDRDADSTDQPAPAPTATETKDDRLACSLFFETMRNARLLIGEIRARGGTATPEQTSRAYYLLSELERAARMGTGDVAVALKTAADAFLPVATGEPLVPTSYDAAMFPAYKLCGPYGGG
jgi:hypothetical protein